VTIAFWVMMVKSSLIYGEMIRGMLYLISNPIILLSSLMVKFANK